MQTKGVVSKLFTKDWNKLTFYSFKLEGDDKYYNTGAKKHPDINPGNMISFEFEKNEKGYLDVNTKTVERIAEAEAVYPNVKQPEVPKKVDWDAKDRVIQLQACRNTAIAFVTMVLANGALKLPTKKEEAYDVVLALVNELTDTWTAENENVKAGKPPRSGGNEQGTSEVEHNIAANPEESPWEEN